MTVFKRGRNTDHKRLSTEQNVTYFGEFKLEGVIF